MHVPVKEKVKKTSKSHISYSMTSMTALAVHSLGDFLCLKRHCILQLWEMFFFLFFFRHFKESHIVKLQGVFKETAPSHEWYTLKKKKWFIGVLGYYSFIYCIILQHFIVVIKLLFIKPHFNHADFWRRKTETALFVW